MAKNNDDGSPGSIDKRNSSYNYTGTLPIRNGVIPSPDQVAPQVRRTAPDNLRNRDGGLKVVNGIIPVPGDLSTYMPRSVAALTEAPSPQPRGRERTGGVTVRNGIIVPPTG